jgi:hypothetical protein
MSGSLASAKAKRAGINPPPPQPQQQQQQQQIPPGVRLSIPQVITMLDSRLSKLESSTKNAAVAPVASTEVPSKFMEDMEDRFMMLAGEIETMKDIIIKLQAFTMDVNKTLFEERIQIMSGVDDGIKSQVVEESIKIEKVSEVEVTAI